MKTKQKLVGAFKIWLAIYPSITLFYYLFGPALSTLVLPLRTLLLTLVLVPWLIFGGLPLVELFLKQLNLQPGKHE